MKIKAKICILFFMALILGTVVYAAEPGIQINSDSKTESGTTKTVIVKVVSDAYKVGTITGKIETNDKIQVENDIVGLNGWSVVYNPENKLFVAYNASGTNSSDVMEFSYTSKAGETGNATITLSDLELSCLSENEYVTKNINNATKTITIEAQQEKPTVEKEETTTQTPQNSPTSNQQKPTTSNQQRPTASNQQSNQQRPTTQAPTIPEIDPEESLENEDEIILEEDLTNEEQEEPTIEEKPIIEKENKTENTVNKEVKIPSKTTLISILVIIIALIIYIVYKSDYKNR